MAGLVKAYGDKIEELIKSYRYDTKEDFTVIHQPFMRYAKLPSLVS